MTWQALAPLSPDGAASRWVRNEITRERIAHRKASGRRGVQIGQEVAGTCPTCGSVPLRVNAGTGPHAASLVCTGCNHFVRWIRRDNVQTAATPGR